MKIKQKWLKLYNRSIVILLSMLGFFSSCIHSGSKYGPPPDIITPPEYGALRHALFILKGTVISEKDNKIIPGIRISQGTDTAHSDINGRFQIEKMSAPTDNLINITLQDTDGKTNGEFLPLDYKVYFNDVPFTGGGGWDIGEAVKEVKIMLKPK